MSFYDLLIVNIFYDKCCYLLILFSDEESGIKWPVSGGKVLGGASPPRFGPKRAIKRPAIVGGGRRRRKTVVTAEKEKKNKKQSRCRGEGRKEEEKKRESVAAGGKKEEERKERKKKMI
ncbi:hypothetical protein ACOSP7_031985 [Xanthoceras sorbifolium]